MVNVPNQSGAYVRGNRGVKRQPTAFTLRLATTMAAGRATPPLLKDLNERTVLEAIRAGAPISRAEISRRVGISKPTVSQALQSLLGAGLVHCAAPPHQTIPIGPVGVDLQPEHRVGADVDRRDLNAAHSI